MENSSEAVLEKILNSFTSAYELMDFEATRALQDSVAVRFRLFQLRNTQYDDTFVDEQLDTLLETFGWETEQSASVRMAESIKAMFIVALWSPAGNRERSGSVVECLTGDRGAAGLSLTSVNSLWSLSKTHLS